MPRLRSDEVIRTSLHLVKLNGVITYHKVADLVGYSPEYYRKAFLPLLLEEANGCIVKSQAYLIWKCKDEKEVATSG